MKQLWRLIGRIGGYVLWLPMWAVIRFTTRTRVLVVCGEEIVLVQGWLSTGSWLVPGGGLHRHEPPAQAALRELQEEIGITFDEDQLIPLGVMRQSKGLAHTFHGFAVRVHTKPTLSLQASEIVAARWVKLGDVSQLRTQQHVSLLLTAWQRRR
jgi:8-oxo-dGTP pyrophosphatase MutT (NUDIX family)